MNSTISRSSDTQAIITVTLDAAALQPVVKQTLNRLRPKVKVAGFRPGKAPDAIVERELGGTLQEEVLQSATRDSYVQAVRQHELLPVGPPQVSLTKFVPYTELEYRATIEVIPEVKLADYTKIKVEKPEAKVEEADVDRVIADLRKRSVEQPEAKLPEINDALRQDIRQHLQEQKADWADQEYDNRLLEDVLQRSKFKRPESMVRQQLERLKAEAEQAGRAVPADWESQFRPEAERRVGIAIVLSEIAQVEQITVSPAELNQEIDRLTHQYSDPAIHQELAGAAGRESVYNHLMALKVIETLRHYAETT
jgi:FKBP-type peptidyl-prolyl cis-trans isomerase (trigger factor)